MRLIRSVMYSLALVPLASCTTLLKPDTSSLASTTVFNAGQDGYKIYRIPAIVQAVNGDLLAFAEGREGGDLSRLDLVMKRSTDQGTSWGKLQTVQSGDAFSALVTPDTEISIGNPAPVVDLMNPDNPGRIWLGFTLENDRVFVSHSDDHGDSWSAAREITAAVKYDDWGWYATGPVHGIQLQRGEHAGRLVIPANHRLGKGGQDRGATGAQVIFSDDHGATWKLGAVDDSYDDGINANETTVVELADSSLLFNTRNQHGAAAASRGDVRSLDGGETFASATDTGYVYFQPSARQLDTPVVQSAILRGALVADGDGCDLLLFSGPDSDGPWGRGRSDLLIRYSLDEADSWRDGLRINIGPAAYSDMVRLGQYRYAVLFETGDTRPYERIDFAPFEADQLEGISFTSSSRECHALHSLE